MSRLRTLQRNLDADAVDRAGKAHFKPEWKGPRIGHRRAGKRVVVSVAPVVIPASRNFFTYLEKKQESAGKKSARWRSLNNLTDSDFSRKVRRYDRRHGATK